VEPTVFVGITNVPVPPLGPVTDTFVAILAKALEYCRVGWLRAPIKVTCPLYSRKFGVYKAESSNISPVDVVGTILEVDDEFGNNFKASRYETNVQLIPSSDESRMVLVLVTPVSSFTSFNSPAIIHILPCHPTQYVEVNVTV
jgi:hypothetical protein